MNLRTLKKLSKRAAPLLRQLGDERLQFAAGREDSYGAHSFVGDRKHWDRSRCHADYEPRNDWSISAGEEILSVTRAGHRILMKPPVHPRKGTPMVGATTGYYEPEWNEETAWDALDTIVRHHFMDWSEDGPTPLRVFRRPSEILSAVQEIVTASTLPPPDEKAAS
jgi:hypothetical protein